MPAYPFDRASHCIRDIRVCVMYCYTVMGFLLLIKMIFTNDFFFVKLQKGLKNVFDEAILAALEPPEQKPRRRCCLF